MMNRRLKSLLGILLLLAALILSFAFDSGPEPGGEINSIQETDRG